MNGIRLAAVNKSAAAWRATGTLRSRPPLTHRVADVRPVTGLQHGRLLILPPDGPAVLAGQWSVSPAPFGWLRLPLAFA
jgi:hypothetical protein